MSISQHSSFHSAPRMWEGQRVWPMMCVAAWVLLILLINHEWIYTPISFVDPAVYIGWFSHPLLYRQLFPLAHAGDLFPFILPNALAYHVFGAMGGNIIIKTASFLLGALCLLSITRRLFNAHTAIICVIAFTCSRYVVMAMGGDYTDGRVMLYLLLSAALAMGAAARDEESSTSFIKIDAMNVAAGAAALCMVSTAILTVVVLPFLFGICLTGQRRVRATISMMTGFALAAMICVVIDMMVMGGDGFYLRNIVRRAMVFINENRVVIGDWKAVGMWLLLPLILVPSGIISCLALIKQDAAYALHTWRGQMAVCLVAGSVMAYGAYVGLQYFRHQETLSNGFYLNFISPLLFILMGAVVYGLLRDVGLRAAWIITGIFAVMSLQVIAGLNMPAPTLHDWVLSPTYAAEMAGAACIMMLLFLAAKYPAGRLIAVIGLVCCANYFSATHIFPDQMNTQGREANFKTMMQWMAQADEQDPQRASYIWYDVHEPAGAAYMQMGAVSHMWSEWGLVSENLPALDDKTYALIRADIKQHEYAGLYVFAATPATVMRAKKLLMEKGLRGEAIAQRDYEWNGKKFAIVKMQLSKLR